MGLFEYGIKNLVNTCLHVKRNEKVLIITDVKTSDISEHIRREAGNLTNRIGFILLEDFGERPITEFPKEIGDAIASSDVTIYAAQSIQGETFPFRRLLLDAAIKSKARHAHMPDVNREVVETGLAVDSEIVQNVTDRVYNEVSNCKEINVRGRNGTDITASFKKRYKWINLGPIVNNGSWSDLPGGEVMTYPDDINGIFVVDGVLGDYFVKYGILKRTPVGLVIEKGVVTEISCKNTILKRELKKYLESVPKGKRVGQFALGTNIFLKDFIGVILQDEKFPTVHIALGNPYPKMTRAPYSAETHVDGITKNVSVFADGKLILQKGKYLI